ncbi:MAG: amino acid ABC transporter ATP-binding protein [Erysipelotrichaceae bacterium]|nr:amino acid ABC transporter ATP-binding protein [Erysipelotrichaceae bacterium]
MISIKNISKSFDNIKILENINLEVSGGEIISIIGPSGSGKSTLLRCIIGLEKADSGEVYYERQLMNLKDKASYQEIRSHMGFVFQHFNLFPNMTVLENCTLALKEVLHKKDDEANKIAMQYLEKVGLLNKAESYPNKLSGGQKQRVAIARALCMNPEIMLFDEPTSALDPEMIKEVLEVIKELKNQGMTMIIVTHEMNFAKNISNRIIFIEDGHIVEENSSQEFFSNPKTQRAKLFLDKVLYD